MLARARLEDARKTRAELEARPLGIPNLVSSCRLSDAEVGEIVELYEDFKNGRTLPRLLLEPPSVPDEDTRDELEELAKTLRGPRTPQRYSAMEKIICTARHQFSGFAFVASFMR